MLMQQLFALALVLACGGCQPGEGSSASPQGTQAASGSPQTGLGQASANPDPQSTAGGGASASSTGATAGSTGPAVDRGKAAVSSKPSPPSLTGRFRLVMKFDEGIKVRSIDNGKGGGTAQPDGSQVSVIELTAKGDAIDGCVQSTLDGVRFSRQPACSGGRDQIELKFSDEKATLGASMVAELRPLSDGTYKGPLMLRVIILPEGKRMGEATLSRM